MLKLNHDGVGVKYYCIAVVFAHFSVTSNLRDNERKGISLARYVKRVVVNIFRALSSP